jgi:hypothetical protein
MKKSTNPAKMIAPKVIECDILQARQQVHWVVEQLSPVIGRDMLVLLKPSESTASTVT